MKRELDVRETQVVGYRWNRLDELDSVAGPKTHCLSLASIIGLRAMNRLASFISLLTKNGST